ncbi:hypothetical protein QBC38DRAFT_486320 [Podospora fimiseda]|uniref:Fucose-specific lectin n=1 Tax=Podospora fimiseda TaxID=252190 RepID=A0AAN7GWK0_9PEZI|nr:hypothetical protein QBC38DRAFT_486320 [Podospora fimiseda]
MTFRASLAPEAVPIPAVPELDTRDVAKQKEVVPLDHSTLEPNNKATTIRDKAELDVETGSSTHLDSTNPHDLQKSKKKRWKRKRYWLTSLIVGALLIAGGVGGYLGHSFSTNKPSDTTTTTNSDDSAPTFAASVPDSDTSDSSPNDFGLCKDNVCRPIFSAVTKGGDPSSMWVFARGGDKKIWYLEGNGVAWANSWKSFPGLFASQPSAATIDIKTNYTAVFAVDNNGTVQINQYRKNKWTGWKEIEGLTSKGAINVCTTKASKDELKPAVHAWVADKNKKVLHWSYSPFLSEDPNSTTAGVHSILDHSTSAAETVGAVPGATCRGTTSNPRFDYITYSPTLKLQHRFLSGKTGEWSDSKSLGGPTFFPDPVVVYTDTHTDWFGVSGGGERAMYHLRWQVSDGTFTGPTKLGNITFESVPSVLVSPDGSRIDVVALASNDHRVKHRTWLASNPEGWTDDWEDLGAYADSAPLLYRMKGQQKDRIALMVLGYAKQMNFTSFEETDSTSWSGLMNWKSAGGKLTFLQITKNW